MILSEEISDALRDKKPIVALESTVIAQGLPYPHNLETAFKLEDIVRESGAIPATTAVFNGEFTAGLSQSQIETLATDKNIRKISRRDLPIAFAKKLNCSTTVATTIFIAHQVGIRVFATGGIGGVHRGPLPDISADLPELAETPIAVICSGAKIVLDLPATREWLETNGITVIGYQSDQFPAFYSRSSGLSVDERCDSAEEIAQIINARDDLNLKNAILITNPIPKEDEIESEFLNDILKVSLSQAELNNVTGKQITPFLLAKMAEVSEGLTLKANIALLKNNAKVAAEIAIALTARP